MNIPMGIVTGRHSADLDILLAPHQLNQAFQVKICDNQVSKPKPNPEGILKASSFLSIPPFNLLYIGDSPVDIQAATAAGMYSVAAIWDSHTNE